MAIGLVALISHRWPGESAAHQPSEPFGYGWFVILAFIPYAWVATRWLRSHEPSRRWRWAATAGIGLVFVITPPIQSHDVYEYLAYGRMQVFHDANPYLTPPDSFARDPVTHLLGWPDSRSDYGPLWDGSMIAVVSVAPGSVRAEAILVKALAWSLVALTGWAIERAVREVGGEGAATRGSLASYLFVFNPLVITSEALGGHADAAIAAGFACAVLADRRGRRSLAVLALAAAALVKIWAILPLAVYLIARWRREGARTAIAASALGAALGVAAYIPYEARVSPLSPVLGTVGRTSSSFAGAIQDLLDRTFRASDWVAKPELTAVDTTRLIALVAIVGLLCWIATRKEIAADPWAAVSLIVGASLLATPWYLPWYSVGLLALGLCVGGGAAVGSLLLSTTSSAALPLLAGGAMLRFVTPALGWGLRERRLRSDQAVSL